jgi:hypothetical protein
VLETLSTRLPSSNVDFAFIWTSFPWTWTIDIHYTLFRYALCSFKSIYGIKVKFSGCSEPRVTISLSFSFESISSNCRVTRDWIRSATSTGTASQRQKCPFVRQRAGNLRPNAGKLSNLPVISLARRTSVQVFEFKIQMGYSKVGHFQ